MGLGNLGILQILAPNRGEGAAPTIIPIGRNSAVGAAPPPRLKANNWDREHPSERRRRRD
jgi:hypothetical protein